MASALTFLEQYHKHGNEFYSHTITDDETWVSFVNVETKVQPKQWMHTQPPNKLKKFKQTLSAYQKVDRNFFLEQESCADGGIMHQGTTIMSEMCCETLKNCVRPFRKKSLEC
jgi:hypothetical protein